MENRKPWRHPDTNGPRVTIAMAKEKLDRIEAITACRSKPARQCTVSSTVRLLINIGLRVWDIGCTYGISTSKALDELMQHTEAAAAIMQQDREARKSAKRTRGANNVKPPAVLLLSGIEPDGK